MASTDTTRAPTVPDADKLQALMFQVITDVGGALIVPLALIGDRLHLFEALRDAGPCTAAELAARTGKDERYLREWLHAMAAAGYVSYLGDAPTNGTRDSAQLARYALNAEQVEVFTNPDSPAFMVGGLQNMTAATRSLDRLTEEFGTGGGMGWHEHHQDMFEGTERFFRPGYLANLTSTWIPALTGVEERLRTGGRVADVGCGFGASSIIMAQAYPNSRFEGVDYHQKSVEAARQRAVAAGVDDRVTFRVAGAADLSGSYDLITFFDCLHDMPDPEGALRAARGALAEGGRVMLVEPISWDSVAESINPIGKVFLGASVFICLPSGLSGEPGAGLGNQAGPTRTLELARAAGFTDAKVAVTGDVNLVYELA